MESIEVTVDALQLVDWGGTLRPADDGWAVDVWLNLAPYQAGQRVTGVAFQQLALLGLVTRYDATLPYPGNDAPATTQVGADMLNWVGQTHGQAAAAWVGKRATAFVAAGE